MQGRGPTQRIGVVTGLPAMVGFGGINPAGRSGFHHAFKRLVYDVPGAPSGQRVLRSLSHLMALTPFGNQWCVRFQRRPGALHFDNTLIREIGPQYFDTERIYSHFPRRILAHYCARYLENAQTRFTKPRCLHTGTFPITVMVS